MMSYLTEIVDLFPTQTAFETMCVLGYQIGDINRSLVYIRAYPEGGSVYIHHIEAGISDALAQLHILCEILGVDFEAAHSQSLPRLHKRMEDIRWTRMKKRLCGKEGD